MFLKRTINFRKTNWQHGFSTTSYIRPGNTAVLVIPSACTTSPSDISRFSFPTPVMKYVTQCITLYRTFISVQSRGCVGSALYQPLLESYNLPPQESHPKRRLRRPFGWRRSRVVTFTAIRRRGLGFKSRPGQKFGNKNLCFRRTPAVLKACHLCRMRPIKTPLYKTRIPILSYKDVLRPYSSRRLPVEKCQ